MNNFVSGKIGRKRRKRRKGVGGEEVKRRRERVVEDRKMRSLRFVYFTTRRKIELEYV